MKALIQRVNQASVNINQSEYSKISKGLLILVGIHKNDSVDDIKFIIDKSINLRIKLINWIKSYKLKERKRRYIDDNRF